QSAQVNAPATLKRDLAAQLVALKEQSETGSQEAYRAQIDQMEASIASFAIRDWSKPPFGAASHAWLPGFNVPEAMDRLKAFSLVGQPGRDNIHVCGEAYSDYQGFIEGSLRSAAKALASIHDYPSFESRYNPLFPTCGSGGTGRRTSLRGWRSQDRVGSN